MRGTSFGTRTTNRCVYLCGRACHSEIYSLSAKLYRIILSNSIPKWVVHFLFDSRLLFYHFFISGGLVKVKKRWYLCYHVRDRKVHIKHHKHSSSQTLWFVRFYKSFRKQNKDNGFSCTEVSEPRNRWTKWMANYIRSLRRIGVSFIHLTTWTEWNAGDPRETRNSAPIFRDSSLFTLGMILTSAPNEFKVVQFNKTTKKSRLVWHSRECIFDH